MIYQTSDININFKKPFSFPDAKNVYSCFRTKKCQKEDFEDSDQGTIIAAEKTQGIVPNSHQHRGRVSTVTKGQGRATEVTPKAHRRIPEVTTEPESPQRCELAASYCPAKTGHKVGNDQKPVFSAGPTIPQKVPSLP